MDKEKVYDIIFFKPTRYEECTKYIKHLRRKEIVHINLSEMGDEDAQRILDFVSGAIFIQEGEVVNLGNKIYCVIPKPNEYMEAYKGGKKSLGKYDDEEEEIVREK
jgi:cell division inhibitor SepF